MLSITGADLSLKHIPAQRAGCNRKLPALHESSLPLWSMARTATQYGKCQLQEGWCVGGGRFYFKDFNSLRNLELG